ncbi:MAG: SlyX family protein, partial [Bdellovibrio sp.]|nr:SlyX family protein [Bdellovibrio sp.]
LETKISHQDFLLEELHQVIYKQQLTIDLLEKKIMALSKHFEETGTTGIEIRGNEKPPHY